MKKNPIPTTKRIIAGLLAGALTIGSVPQVHAQAVQATGRVELDVKKYKDLIVARAAARKVAERDAIKSALKLKLNIDGANPKLEASLDDFVKNEDHIPKDLTGGKKNQRESKIVLLFEGLNKIGEKYHVS